MPVSQTSKETYASIQSKLGTNQIAVLNALHRHPLASNEDIAADLGWTINRVTPRSNELREMGLVKIGGTKKSRTSGKTVQWMYVNKGAS